MKHKPICTLDYETEKIQPRPRHPPKPVGASIILPNRKPKYYAWGHPTENNCTKAEFKKVLKSAVKQYRMLYHHGKFDMEVSEEHFGIALPNYYDWEDSMLLAFLAHPRSRNLKLKQLAEEHLDLPPNEQEELRDWVLDNVPEAKRSKSKWGEYISKAPGKLVGKYANGDTYRTLELFNLFWQHIQDSDMVDAYETEKKLVPIILDMEQRGVPIDVKRLRKDLKDAKLLKAKAEKLFYKRLGKEINMSSPKQKIAAFDEAGLVDEWNYNYDNDGNETSKKTGISDLLEVCNDKTLVKHLKQFSKLTKVIGTYMEPWLHSAEEFGVFYPWFNQTRGDDDKGTKSGRFSSNFQQVPREQDEDVIKLHIPWMRNYVIGDKGCSILKRDFCQQEVRVLSYYEQGDLYDSYLENPNLDVHDLVGELIMNTSGKFLSRPIVKTCNFLIVYGGGAPALSENLNVSIEDARSILKLHRKALPGVAELAKEINDIVKKQGKPIYTAGGREYYAERGFEYRMLNMLIQGGSADHAKRSMIRINDEFKNEDTRILITVHDEFILSTPTSGRVKAMKRFREAMNADDLFNPIPMISDGKIGRSWGEAVLSKKEY